MEIIIGVAGEGQRRQARLLTVMPISSCSSRISVCFRPLAGLDLAAGKFPQARHRLAFRPLRDQHALVGVDQRAGDHEGEFDSAMRLVFWGSGLDEISTDWEGFH